MEQKQHIFVAVGVRAVEKTHVRLAVVRLLFQFGKQRKKCPMWRIDILSGELYLCKPNVLYCWSVFKYGMSDTETMTVSAGEQYMHPEFGEVTVQKLTEQLDEVHVMRPSDASEFQVDWSSVIKTVVEVHRDTDGETFTQELTKFCSLVAE